MISRQSQTTIAPDAIRAAVRAVLPDILASYLFGSHARCDARADSDLDLAILPPAPLAPLLRFEAQQELASRLDCDVDLVDLLDASTVLRSEVLNHGVQLYARDPDLVLDFEARVLGDYAALLEATRTLRDDIQRRGRVHA
jgi:predicted nucleotidyltransferase